MALSDNAKSVINQGNELLPAKRSSTADELQEKASMLLLIVAKLAHERRALEGLFLRATSVEKAMYAQSYNVATGKTAQDKKVNTDADKDVLQAEEEAGGLKADISYVNTMVDVFKNGHVLYRQSMKDENQS